MTKQYQPLTLQITTTPRHLRTQLLAAWPTVLGVTSRLRAIKTITKYIKDTLPADYKSDISVFISNQASSIHEPATQGFLYHLAQQQIVTRQPVKKTNNTALLHVHFTTAQSADENEEKLKTETVAISRIEQIKQWQKETVKAMFQAMADTAISMESQTALRGTMAGLNKLGALLNKAIAAQKLPQGIAKVAAQKTARQDIANTLSDIRGNLSLAAGNGLKPPTKSQLALRQQLNKLDKIMPQQQKAAVKSAPILKTVVATKSTPSSKPIAQAKPTASTRPSITHRFTVKTTPTRGARISIQPLRLNTVAKTFVEPRTAIPGTVIRGTAMPVTPIRSLTHRVATPARLVVGIAQRISSRSVAITAHRFTAAATKLVITKIAQHPTLTKNAAVQSRGIPQLTRTTPRYEINRQIIKRLVVTPAILVAQRVAASPTITDMPAKQVHSGVRTGHSNESKPIAHQIIRQPAHYAAITPQISLNPIAMLQTQQSTPIATPFFVQPRADAILNRVLNTDAPLRSSPLPVTNTNIAQTITSQSSASPIASISNLSPPQTFNTTTDTAHHISTSTPRGTSVEIAKPDAAHQSVKSNVVNSIPQQTGHTGQDPHIAQPPTAQVLKTKPSSDIVNPTVDATTGRTAPLTSPPQVNGEPIIIKTQTVAEPPKEKGLPINKNVTATEADNVFHFLPPPPEKKELSKQPPRPNVIDTRAPLVDAWTTDPNRGKGGTPLPKPMDPTENPAKKSYQVAAFGACAPMIKKPSIADALKQFDALKKSRNAQRARLTA